jgi:2-polyprenyl-6-methoxyphenol hydroxylase-like FAD-dependent oxidoreductase
MVPQARTEAILRNRLGALGGEVEFGKALAAFTQNQHGVDATLSTGERVRADFLAGCDGGHSMVRKALGLRSDGETVDEEPMLVQTSRSVDSIAATGTSGRSPKAA